LGTGVDTVYAGNGNNTIIGSAIATSTGDLLYGGTGNNTFTNPNAGTTFNGTNGAALSTLANNSIFSFTNASAVNPFNTSSTATASGTVTLTNGDYFTYSYVSSTSTTISLYTGTQINSVSYAASPTTATITVNLYTGVGTGGVAQGSTYTSLSGGYNTINEIVASNVSGNTLYPSYNNTILIGSPSYTIFNDQTSLAWSNSAGQTTTSNETVMLIGNSTATNGNYDYVYAGPASEIFDFYKDPNLNYINYQPSPGGIVLNLDSVAHTFAAVSGGGLTTNITSPVTVAAYSGSNWGTNFASSINSYSTGDYFIPVNGSSATPGSLFVYSSNQTGNLVYGGGRFSLLLLLHFNSGYRTE